jgi:FtsP/CotA-like multicopper oxidase with cupredoxin domain
MKKLSRMKTAGVAVAAVTLLAACGSGDDSAAPSGATSEENPCAYQTIPVDTSSLPQPLVYPEKFTEFLPSEPPAPAAPGEGGDLAEDQPEPYEFRELVDPPKLPEGPITTQPAGEYIRNYDPLKIHFSDPAKEKIAGCGVTLRTYQGRPIGPTMRVKPGQTLKFTVQNNLPVHTTGEAHSLDRTNLHTHGLQVDPVGKTVGDKFIAGDNVLITYDPPKHQDYEIKIPADHPLGTFWYHAHAHGSTAPQVSSGMAGPLIVEDDLGNLDKPDSDRSALPESLKVPEKTLIFQSTFYNDKGEIANLNLETGGPKPNWPNSKRRITINDQLIPKITMRPGEIQRWRLISATFEKPLQLRLAEHDLNEIALDGHYLPRVDTWNQFQPLEMAAGYRSDVLVQASTTPGTYMLIDEPAPTGFLATATADEVEDQNASVVAAVVVEGDEVTGKQLPTTAEMQSIAYGWTNGQENTPLEDLWKQDPINSDPDPAKHHVQTVHFNLNDGTKADGSPSKYEKETHFAINGKVFDEAAIRELTLDRVDQWQLVTDTRGAHVFHIHINPFQVFRTGPDGQPERVWKDTLLVRKNPENDPQKPPVPVIMYTKYNIFTGGYVIHCHLLDHEDNGMMQIVEVKKPG